MSQLGGNSGLRLAAVGQDSRFGSVAKYDSVQRINQELPFGSFAARRW
jgi:hypothetical protein